MSALNHSVRVIYTRYSLSVAEICVFSVRYYRDIERVSTIREILFSNENILTGAAITVPNLFTYLNSVNVNNNDDDNNTVARDKSLRYGQKTRK
jgi:hypothetical protein